MLNACKEGDIARVQKLLNNRTDPTVENYNQALRYASLYGYTKIVEILLQDGRADPTHWNNWIIKIACDYGYGDIVELLLQDGRVDPTAGENCCIRFSSIYGHIKVVEILLKDGRVDPTARDNMAINQAKTEEIKEMLNKYKYRIDRPEYCKMKESLEK